MIRYDFHTHSTFSADSKAEIAQMLEKAESIGLKGICITDHMDFEYPYEIPSFHFDPAEYHAAMQDLKEQYKNRIKLYYGIELGLRNEPDIRERTHAYYSGLCGAYPYDFVIGSTHVLEEADPYHASFWEDRKAEDVLPAYFQSILENALAYGQFQVYGHVDYIVRYLPGRPHAYAYGDYADLIDAALKALIQQGRGIELNTSGWRYGLPFPHPRKEILKRYKELKGECITIGSDAHKAEDIAYGFHQAEELLSSLGFRYYTIFENQNPIFQKLGA